MTKKIPVWILSFAGIFLVIDILDTIAFYANPASEYFLPGLNVDSPAVRGATWMLADRCLANASILLIGLLLRSPLVLASGFVLHAIVDVGDIAADVTFGLATAGDVLMLGFIALKVTMAVVLFRLGRAAAQTKYC